MSPVTPFERRLLEGESGAALEERYRTALEEARAQAEALRQAVNTLNDLIRCAEELLENLRSILAYPRAYDWPLLEPPWETSAVSGTPFGPTPSPHARPDAA